MQICRLASDYEYVLRLWMRLKNSLNTRSHHIIISGLFSGSFFLSQIMKSKRINISDLFFRLHRQPKHLLAFLSAELGTVGAVDGNNQLIMKGRFQQKHIENVLRRYIKEYVTCHTCRSPDTILNKETRLFFLQCMTCHSRCSVQTIKTGFQAVTGKRSVMRAKQ